MKKISTIVILLFCTKIFSAPVLPDLNLTTGDVYTTDALVACAAHTGQESDSIRNVPESVSKSVYIKYSLQGNHTGYCAESPKGCEIDHLIPLKLGGKNTPKNLWPQSYSGENGAIKKDILEKKLISRVCRVTKEHPISLSLKTAQKEIATDWLAAYKKYVIENQ